jgi:creatinine amidohydrolase
MQPISSILWQDLTSPELGELAQAGAAVIVPVGAIEQHGPHMPVSTDITSADAVARLAAASIEEFPVLVAPPVWWGVSPHHMAFPGTISLSTETFINLLCEICRSIAAHGFRRILLLNGHGGNAELIGVSAIKLSEEGLFVAAASYFAMITEDLRVIGESPLGGMSHACEMETSLLLAIRPERVHMDRAVKEMGQGRTSYFTWDMREGHPVFYAYDMKRDSKYGVIGDPTLASAEKGEKILAAAGREVAAFLREFKAMPD